MKNLFNFINESLSNKQKELIGELFSKMFKNTKLNKDQIIQILNNLDKEIILEISKYFNDNESENYLAYSPNNDEFLNYKDNQEKIINQISEYIHKYKL